MTHYETHVLRLAGLLRLTGHTLGRTMVMARDLARAADRLAWLAYDRGDDEVENALERDAGHLRRLAHHAQRAMRMQARGSEYAS